MRAADDFEEIRKNLRENALIENRCTCEKGETTGIVVKTNPHCPSHGYWLGEIEGQKKS